MLATAPSFSAQLKKARIQFTRTTPSSSIRPEHQFIFDNQRLVGRTNGTRTNAIDGVARSRLYRAMGGAVICF